MPSSQSSGPWIVVGFSGWNDAGGASFDAVMNIVDRYHLMPSVELDCEDYYDYQILRPVRRVTDSEATITWPTTTLWQGLDEDQPVVCVTGPEPNLRWRRYCADLIEKFARLDPAATTLPLAGTQAARR